MVLQGVARMEGEDLVITSNTKKGEMKRTLVFTEEGMTMVRYLKHNIRIYLNI